MRQPPAPPPPPPWYGGGPGRSHGRTRRGNAVRARKARTELAQLAVVKCNDGGGSGVTLIPCSDSEYDRSKRFQNCSKVQDATLKIHCKIQ